MKAPAPIMQTSIWAWRATTWNEVSVGHAALPSLTAAQMTAVTTEVTIGTPVPTPIPTPTGTAT